MAVEVEQPQLAPSRPLLRMSTEECSRAIRLPRLDSTRLATGPGRGACASPDSAREQVHSQPASPRSLKLVGNSSPKQLAGSTRRGSAQIDVAQRSTLALFGFGRLSCEKVPPPHPSSHQEILSALLLLLGPSRFFPAAGFRTNTFCWSSFNHGLLLHPFLSSTSTLDRTRRPCRRS